MNQSTECWACGEKIERGFHEAVVGVTHTAEQTENNGYLRRCHLRGCSRSGALGDVRILVGSGLIGKGRRSRAFFLSRLYCGF